MRRRRTLSERWVVAHCSPTLAGLKTGSLFPLGAEPGEKTTKFLRALNQKGVPRGLCAVTVCTARGRALLYLYRPAKLWRDLSHPLAQRILRQKGYPINNVGQSVAYLAKRFAKSETFPHEVGLFLGYPPADVNGFLTGSEAAKCIGTWKVYSDVPAALQRFALYEKCTALYCRAFERHASFDRLIVSCS